MLSHQRSLKFSSTVDLLRAKVSLFPFHGGESANHLSTSQELIHSFETQSSMPLSFCITLVAIGDSHSFCLAVPAMVRCIFYN